jgi:inward rectifier potassium channel
MTTKPNQNQRNINISGRKITAIGARKTLFADFYHASMTSNWRTFIGCALLVFLSLNAIFAALFALQPNSIANIPDGKNWYVIYLSIETLATVGYGDMHPATDYAHLVASTETFIGLLFSAVLTGLIFARFAQPRVRILASNAILISQHNNQRSCSELPTSASTTSATQPHGYG